MILRSMRPFMSAMSAAVLAQALKPLFWWLRHKEWHWKLMGASGGFPSSHSAMVSALAVSVGMQEQFRSSIFAVTLTLAVIVIYDAANVRYYSGQNAKVTQQLIRDLKEKYPDLFTDPVYETKLKQVLGHKWREVIGGILLGIAVALLLYRVL
ncbi:MAG: divergent PAP2 family protein [Solobacterium sp.]|nr:divergent PAP2 family protein [Solobacterium sp.]MBQ9825112.1 divergent PAP2 family protein [Solobacterium sp.]